MHGAVAETLATVVLVLTLAVAVARPRGLSEAAAALSAAALLVVTDVVPVHAAVQRVREIGPTVGFLAAILVFGHLCAEAAVFDYLGSVAARASHGSARRLLALVVAIAAAVTGVDAGCDGCIADPGGADDRRATWCSGPTARLRLHPAGQQLLANARAGCSSMPSER